MEEEINKITVKQVSIKYGLMLGLVSIIFFLAMSFTGVIGTDSPVRWVGLVFTVIFIYLAHKSFKDEGDGFMSYGQGLGIGTLVSLISGVIGSIFTYIYIKLVDDTMIINIREQQLIELERQGLSDEQMDQALEFSSTFTSPEFITIFGILGAVFFGFILSLIISAITKNQNPEPQF